jgi:hypothetical protein
LKETFQKGLRKKLKLAITGMLKVMIIEIANLAREIEEALVQQIMVFQDVQVD